MNLPAIGELLGSTAVVLLPLEKLKLNSARGTPFEREIHEYLAGKFNGYTVASGNISGHWKDHSGRDHYGEHREYKVALRGEVERRALGFYLAGLAAELGEECIYSEFGTEVYLIYAIAGATATC